MPRPWSSEFARSLREDREALLYSFLVLRSRLRDGMSSLAKTVKAYVRAAIEIERAGLKVQFKKTEDIEMPEELESKLAANAKLKAAFAALTPGRQRGYILHFSQPKLSTTRAARVEKHIPRILEGLGLDD